MSKRERLYERPLRRPLDEETRQAIEVEFQRRRKEIPISTELIWDAAKPEFTIRSVLVSLFVQFTLERMVVDAELSFAARLLATAANRKKAVDFIESISNDLNL